jgi:hypothetical protein
VHVEAIPDESFGRGTGLHRHALLMYGSEGDRMITVSGRECTRVMRGCQREFVMWAGGPG